MVEQTGHEIDALERRRRRLRFRCWHRGTKELDLLMGPFVDAYLDGMKPRELSELEALLILDDLDLYNWITRRAPVPEAARSDTLDRIIDFHNRP